MKIPQSLADCEAFDADDPLQQIRDRFILPEGMIYLDGHSLGPATHKAIARVAEASSQEWADGLIRSWNGMGDHDGWIGLPERVGAAIAGLIGAQPDEVIVTDSVSVNLFKLAAAAMELVDTKLILIEDSEFPTDQYIAEGLAKLSGATLRRLPQAGAIHALSEQPAVLIKSVVNYRTGAVASITVHEREAAKSGSMVVWDLSHAAGILDLNLNEHGAWLGAGCTYKHLNGGPGAPAYIYARGDLAEKLNTPLSGWMGHAEPFAFDSAYKPRPGVARFASGTPNILSLSALDGALFAFTGADMRLVEHKARALGEIILARCRKLNLEFLSPRDTILRGGHCSIQHEHGYAIVQALIARPESETKVIADFRAPDCMRFGVSPLFLRYADMWRAMDALEDILRTKAWDKPEFHKRSPVT